MGLAFAILSHMAILGSKFIHSLSFPSEWPLPPPAPFLVAFLGESARAAALFRQRASLVLFPFSSFSSATACTLLLPISSISRSTRPLLTVIFSSPLASFALTPPFPPSGSPITPLDPPVVPSLPSRPVSPAPRDVRVCSPLSPHPSSFPQLVFLPSAWLLVSQSLLHLRPEEHLSRTRLLCSLHFYRPPPSGDLHGRSTREGKKGDGRRGIKPPRLQHQISSGRSTREGKSISH